MKTFDTILCMDGSGDRDIRRADRKRPIYELEQCGTISRVVLAKNQSAFAFFEAKIDKSSESGTILIAVDVPIGLPETPKDVYENLSFMEWLKDRDKRLKENQTHWREGLIAQGVDSRTSEKPFVSIGKGESIGDWAGKRECDRISRGESVYCLDHGAKQVGRAALQFWFDVLIPLKLKFADKIAVWPFEPVDGRCVVIAECYPAQCHRMVFGRLVNKRSACAVADSLVTITQDPNRNHGIDIATWIRAASSEDEFDIFTTALAFREARERNQNLLIASGGEACKTIEGWMLGLSLTQQGSDNEEMTPQGADTSERSRILKVPVGTQNRNHQENCGPSGLRGPKGELSRMKCRRKGSDDCECGHNYETNPQDVFHKKCPKCQ